jgi:hypothetical protein
LRDAVKGVIKFEKTIPYQSAPTRLEVPYGSYLITLEYFADAAKTQNLATSCSSEQNRIHQVSAETYNPTIMVCTEPKDADVVIRPVVR